MAVHDFAERLDRERQNNDVIEKALNEHWDCAKVVSNDDKLTQKAGIDYTLVLRNTRVLTVDVKWRDRPYGSDVLIELEHVLKREPSRVGRKNLN